MKIGMTKKFVDHISYEVIGAAIEVHKALGPGLLESIYHKCMKHELGLRKLSFESEKNVPIVFKEFYSNTDLRCDLFVENCVLVELKSVDLIAPIFITKTISYSNLLEAGKGILINFNVNNIFKEGQKTFVTKFYETLPNE